MKWYEINIKTTSEAVDLVGEILAEFGIEGYSIIDPKDADFFNKDKAKWDFMNPDEIFDLDFEGVLISAYMDPADVGEYDNIKAIAKKVTTRMESLKEFNVDIGLGSVIFGEVESDEWQNKWKEFYKPFKIGKNIIVKPNWEELDESLDNKDSIIIDIEPGNAFGSGTHETTFMCMEIIEDLFIGNLSIDNSNVKNHKEIESAIDVGCGSGILAITAAKFGIKDIIAIDIDEDAVITAGENAVNNKVDQFIDVKAGNLIEVVEKKYDLIIANILAEVIVMLTKDVSKVMTENGLFIASGIINKKKDMIVETLENSGFDIVQIIEKGEWVAILSTLK